MKKAKITLLTSIILINSILTTGCWNYREVDKLAIIAGVAVDKGINSPYRITAEIVKISGGKDTKTESETVSMEGKTVFDAVRNGISLTGDKLYWSHAKIIIISEEVAREGISKIFDWYNRDAETRRDVHVLISRENTAREIFKGKGTTEEIRSFIIDDMLNNQRSLSKAPEIDVLDFDNDLEAEGISPIAPTVYLRQIDEKTVPQVMGAAIFKKEKLVGFLNGDETKYLMFIRDDIKGGLLIEGTQENEITTPVSLEIFRSKTQLTPVIEGSEIKINLKFVTTVAIDEIAGMENYIDDEGRAKLQHSAEESLKSGIEALIEKLQSQYGVDIFGFGAKLREDNFAAWNSVSSNWGETFRELKVDVKTKVHIKNSALLTKTLEESE